MFLREKSSTYHLRFVSFNQVACKFFYWCMRLPTLYIERYDVEGAIRAELKQTTS
jgi:hypothetical protein